MVLLMVIALSAVSYNDHDNEVWKGTAISGMIAHLLYILLAGYTLFNKNKSKSINLNNTNQRGGRWR